MGRGVEINAGVTASICVSWLSVMYQTGQGEGGKDDASLVSIHMQLVMGQFEYIQVLMRKLMPGLCNARGISLKN